MESAKYARSQANFRKGKVSRKIKAHVVIRASDNSKNIGSSILNQPKSCLKTSESVSRLGKEAKHHASIFIKLQQSTNDNIFSQRTSNEMSEPSLGTPKFSVHDSKHSNLHKKKHCESESRDFHFLNNFELESISKNNNENKNLMCKNFGVLKSQIHIQPKAYHVPIINNLKSSKCVQRQLEDSSNNSSLSSQNSSQQSLAFKRRNIPRKQNKISLFKAKNELRLISDAPYNINNCKGSNWNIAESIESTFKKSINMLNKQQLSFKIVRSSSLQKKFENKLTKLDSFKSKESDQIFSSRTKDSFRSKSCFSHKSEDIKAVKHVRFGDNFGEGPFIQVHEVVTEYSKAQHIPIIKKADKVKQTCACNIF